MSIYYTVGIYQSCQFNYNQQFFNYTCICSTALVVHLCYEMQGIVVRGCPLFIKVCKFPALSRFWCIVCIYCTI